MNSSSLTGLVNICDGLKAVLPSSRDSVLHTVVLMTCPLREALHVQLLHKVRVAIFQLAHLLHQGICSVGFSHLFNIGILHSGLKGCFGLGRLLLESHFVYLHDYI